MSLIAAQISSVLTRMTSSTTSRASRNVSSPTVRTATPSANVPTWSSVNGAPRFSDSYMLDGLERLDADDLARSDGAASCTRRCRRSTRRRRSARRSPSGTLLPLALELDCDRALARDHVGVVERVDERAAAARPRARARSGSRRRRSRPSSTTSPPSAATASILIDRRGRRHHDRRVDSALARRERDALRVIAGRAANHAALERGRADSCAILLYAPRSLNENTAWRSSRLNEDVVAEPLRQTPRASRAAT